MGGALLVAFPLFQALGLASPLKEKQAKVHKWAARKVDTKAVMGGVLFGEQHDTCERCCAAYQFSDSS